MRHFRQFSNNVAKQVFLYVIKVMLAHLTPESRDPRTAIYEEKELEREKGKRAQRHKGMMKDSRKLA